jgi:hypothetical protein
VPVSGEEFLDKAPVAPIEQTMRASSGYGFVREMLAAGEKVVRITKVSEVSTRANDWTLVIYSARQRLRSQGQG